MKWNIANYSNALYSGLVRKMVKNENLEKLIFLDAPSHLYMRLCPSVRPSVARSVSPSPVIFKRALGASCAVYPALFN